MTKPNRPALSGRIILAGNPNVGKSTLFNALTGKKVHTGNWSGKTVSATEAVSIHNRKKYVIEDLPGISSLTYPNAEEIAAFNAITAQSYDCCLIVADATNLTRSLALVLRILEATPRCVLAINLFDEAEKQGIKINAEALSFVLGIPVILTSARHKKGITELLDMCEKVCEGAFSQAVFTPLYSSETENFLASLPYDRKEALSKFYSLKGNDSIKEDIALKVSNLSASIAKVCTTASKPSAASLPDKIFCSPIFGIPIMILLLCTVLYITIVVSNYPSELLSLLFKKGEVLLSGVLSGLSLPDFVKGLIAEGIYATTSTVVAVMLPPMAIFFPLFAILEDYGYLPRVAFNLDNAFRKCGSCGKQALCMCMGLGCNCVGITNSAIIPSKREKLISILTNSITPCNGRFGAIIACISVFFSNGNPLFSALFTALVLIFSFLTTFLATFILSKTLFKGEKSVFILEMPPYRKPLFVKTVISSFSRHIIHILIRAVSLASPMGGIIYFLNYKNLLLPAADFLNPLASLMGLDGIILLSFVLAFPANEIVFPVMLMLYTQTSAMVDSFSLSALQTILVQNNWSMATAISFIIFTLLHWPCFAATVSAKKEAGSIKWAILAIVVPTTLGIAFCMLFHGVFTLFNV